MTKIIISTTAPEASFKLHAPNMLVRNLFDELSISWKLREKFPDDEGWTLTLHGETVRGHRWFNHGDIESKFKELRIPKDKYDLVLNEWWLLHNKRRATNMDS